MAGTGLDATAQGKASVFKAELAGRRELGAVVGIDWLLLKQEAVVSGDHRLAALEAGDLAQDQLQLIKGLLHCLAGVGLAFALVADAVDAVVVDHDQVVVAGEFGTLLAGGEAEEILRFDRLGAATGIGLEQLVAVLSAGGALAIHQGIGIAGVEAQLHTGQQRCHPQLRVAGQHSQ